MDRDNYTIYTKISRVSLVEAMKDTNTGGEKTIDIVPILLFVQNLYYVKASYKCGI